MFIGLKLHKFNNYTTIVWIVLFHSLPFVKQILNLFKLELIYLLEYAHNESIRLQILTGQAYSCEQIDRIVYIV